MRSTLKPRVNECTLMTYDQQIWKDSEFILVETGVSGENLPRRLSANQIHIHPLASYAKTIGLETPPPPPHTHTLYAFYLFYFILFYFILFYFILFYFILFYFILSY